MGARHEHDTTRHGFTTVVRLVTVALVAAAIVKEIRTPPEDRAWNGVVAGFVPYDFRVPTLTRVKERVWAPQSAKLVNPRVFGLGWTINAGRVVELVRRRARQSTTPDA